MHAYICFIYLLGGGMKRTKIRHSVVFLGRMIDGPQYSGLRGMCEAHV